MQPFSTQKNQGHSVKPISSPSPRASRVRRGWARPRFALGAAAIALAGATWAALAAPASHSKPVPMSHSASSSARLASAGTGSRGPLKLSDLPNMVEGYGAAKHAAIAASRLRSPRVASRPGVVTSQLAGNGQSGFNLVETDLTPNSVSDERQPAVSPNGALIAFISTGTAANGVLSGANANGKFHVFLMNRNGSGVRQVTGLSATLNGTTGDFSRNQSRPSWSQDGNQLVYVDEDPTDSTSTQLWIVDALTIGAQPSQRTYFKGSKSAPAYSPSGLSIAFSTDYDARPSTLPVNQQLSGRSLFSVSPSGAASSIARLTGDPTADQTGVGAIDDNPAWAIVNTNVLFFSSNRDNNGVLPAGRRIWKVNGDGTKVAQISDPTKRPNGQVSDEDDFPSLSPTATFNNRIAQTTIGEQVAFQTNSFIDSTDAADGPRGRDLNIWSLPVNNTPAPPPVTEPRIYIGKYGNDGKDGDGVYVYNTQTLRPSALVPFIALSSGNSQDPEGILLQGGDIYVSDRGTNSIDRFREFDGSPNPSNIGTNSSRYQFTRSLVPSPSGLLAYNDFLFAAGGFAPGSTTNTTALYRFDNGRTSSTRGAEKGATPGTAAYSSGENLDGRVTNGVENLLQGEGIFSNIAFASVLIDNKINAYNLDTGLFLSNATNPTDTKTFVTTGQTSNVAGVTVPGADLNLPTGSAWGPDLNGDGFRDLYICSSGDDAIKVYAGPNTTLSENIASDPFFPVGPRNAAGRRTVRPGTFIKTLIGPEANGNLTGLNAPERIIIRTSGVVTAIYVSSFRARGSDTQPGTQINRYQLQSTTALSWPAGQDPQPGNVDAGWITGLFGPASFAFNNPAPPNTNALPPPLEDGTSSGTAQVISNILSSPANFSASGLTPPAGDGVDRAADREPSFGRSTATSQTLATLVFASGRRYQATQNGPLVNPSGGDQGTAGVTHDIWSTSTQDTTPPALIPQGAGNLQTPVVSPGPNSPFVAPRTSEAGLRAGQPAGTPAEQGGLRFAVVLRDLESGLVARNFPPTQFLPSATDSVTVQFFDADARSFTNQRLPSNEGRTASVQYEGRPAPVSITNPVSGIASTSFALNVYDDGPVSAGGHEQQADAVKGDGNFYCEGFLPTPQAAGDFYIDVNVSDRASNSLKYDRVWGFSTRQFNRNFSDLFVSDYAGGQDFPNNIASAGDDFRFANQPPVESYFLSNPGGQDITVPAMGGGPVVINDASTTTSFRNVDVWRILCRGPVTTELLNAYRPTVVPQLDPNDPTGNFTQLTRQVVSSKSAVIWASPYAGTTFVGPGTITDPATQSLLTSFLSVGGRFFLSGRDVAWALTSGGRTTNQFLSNQLGATFAGELTTNQVQAGPGEFLDGGSGVNDQPSFDTSGDFGGDYVNLQFPIHGGDPNTWPDGATDLNPGSNFGPDLLTQTAVPNGTVVPAYTLAGKNVGQRIEQAQTNGIRSRAVFFSFGFESINRRYRQRTPNDGRIIVDSRYRVASYILSYFKTGSLSGTVINDANNTPISGFLLRVTGSAGTTFVARTDANGNYSLDGLPFDSYTVTPYIRNGMTDPPGYFGGTTNGGGIYLNGPDARNINLRPIPMRPGTISGKATSLDSTDPNASYPPIPNMPVLLVSKRALSTPNPVGFFAELTRTDALGNFSFSQVPSGEEMRIIFNPKTGFFNPPTGQPTGDFPFGSNIPFDDSQRLSNFGRREIPDATGGKRTGPIVVDSNANFIVNDVVTDTPADEGVPIFVAPPTTQAIVTGTVSVNGVQSAAAGATVELRSSTGASLVPPRTAIVAADGTYSFTNVPSGSFQVVATLGNLSGVSGTVTVANLATTVTVPDIPLVAGNVPTPTPTPTPVAPTGSGPVFSTGRSYAISFPYETSPNAQTRNLFDNSADDATISIANAFNYGPTQTSTDNSATRLYSVSQFDTNTLSYIQLPDDALLHRGAGYLLTVSRLPVNSLPLQATTALENVAAQPLSDPATKNQFSIVLSRNSSLNDNSLAGSNFIGFGFDPTQFSSVKWDTTTPDANNSSVAVTFGTRTYSLAQAVGNAPVDRLGTRISLLGSSLTTIDPATGVVTPTTSLMPFGGYFVIAKREGLTLTFKNPSTNANVGATIGANMTVGFSMPYATSPDAAGTVTVGDALSSASPFTVYAFNAATQTGGSRLVTGSNFIPLASTDLLQRGVGYVIVTGASPVTVNTPATNAALVPFAGTTFPILLRKNPANTIATRNGFNLIGSPFDPGAYGNTSFALAKVSVTINGVTKTYSSVKEAAARGVISARLFTPDASGNMVPVPLNDQFLRPFRSYFVQVFKDNVTLTLTAASR